LIFFGQEPGCQFQAYLVRRLSSHCYSFLFAVPPRSKRRNIAKMFYGQRAGYPSDHNLANVQNSKFCPDLFVVIIATTLPFIHAYYIAIWQVRFLAHTKISTVGRKVSGGQPIDAQYRRQI
jgi:hypothetical protein